MKSAFDMSRKSSDGRGEGGSGVGEVATDGVGSVPLVPGVGVPTTAVDGVVDGLAAGPRDNTCEMAMRTTPTTMAMATADSVVRRRGPPAAPGGLEGVRPGGTSDEDGPLAGAVAEDMPSGSGGIGFLVVGVSSAMSSTVYEHRRSRP
jgi:hypothetical protein